MGEIGPRIRQARETYRGVGMKQNALARLLGISSARLSNWERGENDPDSGYVIRAARELEVSPKWLMTGEAERPSDPLPDMMRTKAAPMGRLRLYNAASAGLGNASSIHDFEVEVPAQLCRADYGALYVEGDSMEPLLKSGDVAVFQDTSDARPRDVICGTVGAEGEEEWIIKQLGKDHNGTLYLSSLNPDYEAIYGAFTVHGKLVGYYRREGMEQSTRYNPLGLKAI